MPLPSFAALVVLSLLAGCSTVPPSAQAPAGEAAASASTPPAKTTVSPSPDRSRQRPAPAPRVAADAPVRVALAQGAPDTYVVQRGDTLWDISERFLDEPWRWPEIWYVNEQIANPHLIYPGDRISLIYVDGVPQLRIERGDVMARPSEAERLSPRMREQSLEEAVPTIPYDAIAPFLSRPTVLGRAEIRAAPYILRLKGEHLIGGQGMSAYVRGPGLSQGATFSALHLGERLRDPENGRVIGREALYVGQVRIEREGDPATAFLSSTAREALEGDILVPVETDLPLYFLPSAPEERIEGSIVEVVDGLSLIGQYQIVVLNRGREDGLEAGHVLEVFQRGERVRDRTRTGPFNKVRLPEEYAGRVLVFRTLEALSYALVMSATSEMRVADLVRTPGELSSREISERARMASDRR